MIVPLSIHCSLVLLATVHKALAHANMGWQLGLMNKYLLQGLPVLVGLVEDNMQDNSSLTQIGVQCVWRVLEVHGAGPFNHLCRLLSNAGLPHRLMRAMLSLSQEHQILLKQAEVQAAVLHNRIAVYLQLTSGSPLAFVFDPCATMPTALGLHCKSLAVLPSNPIIV